jgi:hypothetical protein
MAAGRLIGRNLDDLFDAAHRHRPGRIEAFDLAAIDRAALDRGVSDSLERDIGAERGFALQYRRHIDAGDSVPDITPRAEILETQLFRVGNRQIHCRLDQLRIGQDARGRDVDDLMVDGTAIGDQRAPSLGGGGFQLLRD